MRLTFLVFIAALLTVLLALTRELYSPLEVDPLVLEKIKQPFEFNKKLIGTWSTEINGREYQIVFFDHGIGEYKEIEFQRENGQKESNIIGFSVRTQKLRWGTKDDILYLCLYSGSPFDTEPKKEDYSTWDYQLKEPDKLLIMHTPLKIEFKKEEEIAN